MCSAFSASGSAPAPWAATLAGDATAFPQEASATYAQFLQRAETSGWELPSVEETQDHADEWLKGMRRRTRAVPQDITP